MLTVIVRGSVEECKRTICAAQEQHIQLLELRIDLMPTWDIATIKMLLHRCKLPVIFTLRRRDQGGKFPGTEGEREEILLRLTQLKPTYIDLEYDVSFREKIPEGIKVIVSYHNFSKMPEDLGSIYETMLPLRADIYKIACKGHSSLDALKMLKFVQEHKKIAGICMGKYGEITRILSPIVNNALTYAPLEGGNGVMPGQVSVGDLLGIYHFDRLNDHTHIYALIGEPVDQSVGPHFYNLIFQKLEKNAVYVKLLITPKELPTLLRLIENLPFHGLSVTMPLKEQILPYLDEIDLKAKQIKAVNTVVKRLKGWEGYNTDAPGGLDAIERKAGGVSGKTLLILGGGGTAKALAHEGAQRGGEIIVVNRTKARAERLAAQVGGEWAQPGELPSIRYDFLINATCVGMAPSTKDIPIDPRYIIKDSTVFDVVSNPKETALLTAAREKGCAVVFGYEMYVEQACRQFELWFGHPCTASRPHLKSHYLSLHKATKK